MTKDDGYPMVEFFDLIDVLAWGPLIAHLTSCVASVSLNPTLRCRNSLCLADYRFGFGGTDFAFNFA